MEQKCPSWEVHLEMIKFSWYSQRYSYFSLWGYLWRLYLHLGSRASHLSNRRSIDQSSAPPVCKLHPQARLIYPFKVFFFSFLLIFIKHSLVVCFSSQTDIYAPWLALLMCLVSREHIQCWGAWLWSSHSSSLSGPCCAADHNITCMYPSVCV